MVLLEVDVEEDEKGVFVVVVVVVDDNEEEDDVVADPDTEMKEGSMVFASPHNLIPSKMKVWASLVDDHNGVVLVVRASNF